MSEDFDKTRPPLRITIAPEMDATMPGRRVLEPIAEPLDVDATMPGRRDRKDDGRFAVGDLIMNRYKVLSELGQGGMGVVYRCLDETAGVEVALKALPPELSHNTLEMEDIKENFQLVSQLVHQNIAVYKNLERDLANGNYYLIMECCEGEDLRRWIKRKRKEGTLTLEAVLPIIQQVAAALDYAHSEKIIHRDIKPGNIMIDQSGKIKVLDFGLAAQIHTSMTRVSMAYHGTSGTGPYMAPEQWRGRQQDAHADQYALAVMTYEMLAGHLPFESSDAAVLKQAVLDENPAPVKNIPNYASAAIDRAMSKTPEHRFVTCSEFAAALSGKKVKGAVKTDKRIWVKWAAVAMIFALLGAGVYGYYTFDRQQKDKLAAKKAEEVRQAQLAAKRAEELAAKQAEEVRQAQLAVKQAEELAAKKAKEVRQAQLAAKQAEAANQARLDAEKAERTRQAQLAAEQAEAARKAQLAAKQAEELAAKKAEEARQAQLAAKKAEEARQAQLAAEKTERESGVEHSANAYQPTISDEQLDSENAALQVELQEKIAEIKRRNYDQADTFGQKINDMDKAFAIAGKAKLLITANKKYKEAQALADWILLNGELRKECQSLRKQAKNNQTAALEYEPETYAVELYRNAEKSCQEAEESYKNVDFAAAKKNFETAANGFDQARKTAFDNKLQFLIKEAEKAKNSAQWNEVKSIAEKIRPLDSVKAAEFIAFAEKQITLEKFNNRLAAARQAKAEKNWQKVYGNAATALLIDSSSVEARNLRDEAEKQIKSEKLNNELSAARQAKAKKNWQIVQNHAVKALEIDGASEEAQNLMHEAEKQIKLDLILDLIKEAENAKKSANWDEVKDVAEKIRPLDSVKADNLIAFAEKQIKQDKLDDELAAAREAKVEKNWQKVYEYAEAALNIDSSSIEAKNLMYEAKKQIKQEKLNKALSAARQAKAEKNWQKVYEHAWAVSQIDNNNSEAQDLLREAEPTLEIIATVDGRRVTAKVTIDGVQSDTIQVIKNFHANKQYEIALRYQNGDDVYVNNINLTCNWGKRKTITVELHRPKITITLSNGVKVEMVLVEPGSFTMSKKDGENMYSEVEHTKTLTKPFYIGKYEVTQAQYQAVMGKNPSIFKGDNRPVEYVSWYDAREFCEKMNKYAPPGWQFTLPTETQWEYAARGGNKSRGYKYSGGNDLDSVGWYHGNSGRTTHVVGRKIPNELGLYDMSGNVYEWCLDNWQGKSNNTTAEFTRAYIGYVELDRVIRGGCWLSGALECRSAYRNYLDPSFSRIDSWYGFRLALVQAE